MHARLSHVTHVALHRRHLRMTCPRCRQSRILHGVAVWWLFERKSWNDSMGKVAVHFYCAACQKLGHRVVSVANGDDAIAAVKRDVYDVVLMDIWMPKMDGLSATRRIAEECPREHRPRVIAVTADATPETRTNCALAGMVDHVIKPLDLDRLRYALNRAMRHAPA